MTLRDAVILGGGANFCPWIFFLLHKQGSVFLSGILKVYCSVETKKNVTATTAGGLPAHTQTATRQGQDRRAFVAAAGETPPMKKDYAARISRSSIVATLVNLCALVGLESRNVCQYFRSAVSAPRS